MIPIERAARALADVMFVKRIRDCEAPDAPPLVRPFGWENLSAIERSSAMEAAHAVVQAIREPSGSHLPPPPDRPIRWKP